MRLTTRARAALTVAATLLTLLAIVTVAAPAYAAPRVPRGRTQVATLESDPGFTIVRGYDLCQRRSQTFTIERDGARTYYLLHPVRRTLDGWDVTRRDPDGTRVHSSFTLDPALCYGVTDDGNPFGPGVSGG